ncbi:MAG: CDC27 family protein [Candidatus Omnitrophota bacterium]
MNMTQLLALSLSIFLASASFSFALQAAPDQEKYQKDMVNVFDGNFSAAQEVRDDIRAIEEAIDESPGDPSLYYELALIYGSVKNYSKTIEFLKKTIAYSSDDQKLLIALHCILAKQYMWIKDFNKAREAIDKIRGHDPENLFVYTVDTEYFILKKDWVKAAKKLKEAEGACAAENIDCYWDAWNFCLKKVKSKKDIIELFRLGVEENPNSAKAHRAYAAALRGSFETIQEDFPIVMQELQKAYELDPKYVPTMLMIANTHMFLGISSKDKSHFKDALSWFSKARSADPKNLRSLYALGYFYYLTGDNLKAIKKLEYLLKKNPDDEDVTEILAYSYNNQAFHAHYETGKNLSRGLRLIEKAIKLLPYSAVILSTKAELLYKMGKLSEAKKVINQAAVFAPSHPSVKKDIFVIEEALKSRGQ